MTINCNGNLLDLNVPKVMGILNITPNSFYDGGKFKLEKDVLNQVEKMVFEGMSIIDVGAYSSKPNAEFVSESDEMERLKPILSLLFKHFPELIISIDTFRSSVAEFSLQNGASIINDISAGSLDEKMFEVIANFKVPYVMMHMKGTPQTMLKHTKYENLVKEILFYFSKKIALARSFGIIDLIIDPGFGFAKTLDQNFELLQKLDLFSCFEMPILVGLSRKSMIYKTLETTAEFALNGTSVLNTISLQKGAKILRVHDVKEAVECIKLNEKLTTKHSALM